MFQFPDDDDDDVNVEDLLNLPLEKSINNNQSCVDEISNGNLKNILDDCDDDELILSAIKNVDHSIIPLQPKQSFDINEPRTFSSIGRDNQEDNVKSSNQSTIERYTISNNVKHKLPASNNTETSKAPRVEYERKFPGPAGLIPKKSKQNTPVKDEISIRSGLPKVELPSSDDVIFENGCWDQLLADVETISPKLKTILDENTVVSVKRMNIIRNTPRKLPFFAAIILHIDCSVCDPSIILKDSTGEIRGTVHKDLWENHSNLLTVGTALLMKQVSVLSISNSRKLYVNVTGNNIVKIYTPRSGCPVLITPLMKVSEQDLIQTKKNDRIVFEETHPNKMINHMPSSRFSWGKEIDTQKSSTTPVKTNKTENKVPSKFKFKPKSNQFAIESESVALSNENSLLQNSSQIPIHKDIISNELEGIDADSLFGEF